MTGAPALARAAAIPRAQATAGADDECDLSFDVHEVVPPSDTDAAAWMIHGQ